MRRQVGELTLQTHFNKPTGREFASMQGEFILGQMGLLTTDDIAGKGELVVYLMARQTI